MADVAIEVRDVSWTYFGADAAVLHGVSLTVTAGECVVLTGPSGCGKTTLTCALNGLIPHFYEGELAGEVNVAGLDVRAAAPYEIARRVGSVFQDPRSQFFATTTTDEVAFGCENLGLPPAQIEARVAEAFSAIGAEELRDESIFELSSGQKQKVAVAGVLAMRPSVLVLDEPSANLDNEAACTLADILASLKRAGTTIVIAEHRLSYLMDV